MAHARCGLRICEALAVEKSDFRHDERTLRLTGQASRDGPKKMPLKHRKMGEYRDIPVPAWLWDMVKDLPDGPLCPGNGRLYAVYSTVDGQFVKHVPVRADINETYRPYGHLLPNANDKAIAALDAEFERCKTA